ncbi:hypothetical protein CVT24_001090 [Panaeolus cyanescens]|uniref:Uncharacterized protein n=1 Tax=Panaeolus cyanescens TaxID=181874 RepID=A0A409YTF8_9AGAR|nr:hypothetical protein CVT24_001090 [Panaeolus cyanescens]
MDVADRAHTRPSDRGRRDASAIAQGIKGSYPEHHPFIRNKNSWNVYQTYFSTHPEEEIGRLHESQRPTELHQTTKEHIVKAFEAFKLFYGEAHKDFLDIQSQIQAIEMAECMSPRSRALLFKQYFAKRIIPLMEAATAFGFHSSLEVCSGIPGQDEGFYMSHQTSAAKEFYQKTLKIDKDLLAKKFQAHVMYWTVNPHDQCSDSDDSNINHVSDITPEGLAMSRGLGDPHDAGSVSPTCQTKTSKSIARRATIRQGIKKLLDNHQPPGSPARKKIKGLVWKGLPKFLALRRQTIINWPRSAALPDADTSEKGISNMNATGQDEL